MADGLPFDPLAVENVGVVLAVELLSQPLHHLPPEKAFAGAGVYALYYNGPHDAYRSLVKLNGGKWRYPVYIGQAMRENAKQGFSPRPTTRQRIFSRLKNHADSIKQIQNLSVNDFRCRYLVVNDAYIGLAEAVLITTFRPVWNGMGLGSKVVGGPRMSGEVSLWDSIHPGRGGRPAGAHRALEAAEKMAESVEALQREPDDPRVQWMLERIRKFL